MWVPDARGGEVGQVRLLVVDDDASLLRAFDRSFGRQYTVTTADSGEAALRLLAARGIDVVIVDYAMPGMSGVELLRQVACHHPAVGRLLLTAYADLPEVVELKATELVAAVLQKPWDRGDVDAAIARATRLASMRRAVASMRARMAPQE
jgi:DNA-binding NtrC family response regulator